MQRTKLRHVSIIAAGQVQSVTYAAPFTFPWIDSSTDDGGIVFSAGKQGMLLYVLPYSMSCWVVLHLTVAAASLAWQSFLVCAYL